MSKYKRVWAMLGVVGLLGALMALSAVAPTPAGADTGPDNVINLTKLVSGTPDAANPVFGLGVFCEDPDPTVVEDPSVTANPDVDFEGGGQAHSGESVVVSIPAYYLECSFFELNSQNADRTAVFANSPTAPATTITIGSGLDATNQSANYATFAPGGSQTVNAFIANQYNATTNATIRITKVVVGAAPVGAFYQIRVTCTEDLAAGPNQVVPARVVDTVFLAPGTQNVLVPTTDADGNPKACTPRVQENVTSGAVDTYLPAAAPGAGLDTIPGGTADTRDVRVTNTFAGPVNQITVTKTVVGTAPAGTQHTVDVRCINPNTGASYVASLYAMNAGETHVFSTPAAFSVCAVQETNHAWDTPAKDPDSIGVVTFPVQGAVLRSYAGSGCGAIPELGPLQNAFLLGGAGRTCSAFGFTNGNGGQVATVGITNRYVDGPFHTITVNKATTGAVPPGTVFVVQVQCDVPIDGPGGVGPTIVHMAFGPGLPETQSINWAAFTSGGNSDCTITEINSGGAVSQTYASGPSSPNTLLHVFQNPNGRVWIDWDQATTGESAQVNIVNRFNPKNLPDNTLRIKKQLRGRASTGPFTIQVRCSGGGITDTRTLTFSTNSFQEISVPAHRSDCRVVETANGGAQSVSYFASSATADATDGPLSARVNFGTVEGGQRGKVIVRNQFPGTCPRPGPKFC